MSQGSGLTPSLQRNPNQGRVPPPMSHPHVQFEGKGHEEMDPETDDYEAAEQGLRYPERQQKPGQGPPPRGRQPPPRADSAKPGSADATWLERNRNLVIVSIGVLIVLVILLIWYQFSRQPAPVLPPVRGAGQPRQQGAPPERSETAPETAPEEPSEAVDEEVETDENPEVQATKPKPPAAKAPAAKKKAAAKATEGTSANPQRPKRERVHGDPIRTADDKEISEFANMDISTAESTEQAEEAEEVETN